MARAFAIAALAVACLGLAAGPLRAEPPPTVEGVTVEGRAAPDVAVVNRYVRAALVREHRESVVRWHRPICPLVAGLTREQGEFIAARLTQAALDAGAPLGKADCKPNIYIVVTSEPRALLKAWRKRDVNLFGHEIPVRVNRFIDTERPIRVWHNWAFEDPHAPDRSTVGTRRRGQPETGGRLRNSRIVVPVVRNDWGVITVVDSARIQGANLGQVADFIAIAALTEADLDADLGDAPTILRLFSPAATDPPAGITDWDRALLKALYASDQSLQAQTAVIANRMMRDLRE